MLTLLAVLAAVVSFSNDVRNPDSIVSPVASLPASDDNVAASSTSDQSAGKPSKKPVGAAGSQLAVGKPAIHFNGKLLSGKSVKFPDDFKGKVVLLDFWATWCGPCMTEVPSLVASYKKYHDKGFEILGVSLDQKGTKAKIEKVMSERSMTWPQVYDGGYWKAAVAVKYGITSIPRAFLVDGDTGKILAMGSQTRGESLDATISSALDAKINEAKKSDAKKDAKKEDKAKNDKAKDDKAKDDKAKDDKAKDDQAKDDTKR